MELYALIVKTVNNRKGRANIEYGGGPPGGPVFVIPRVVIEVVASHDCYYDKKT